MGGLGCEYAFIVRFVCGISHGQAGTDRQR